MPEDINDSKDIGAMVRHAREEQGLTQDDLAGLTGMGRRFISELENGKETAQLMKVLLVLSALGVGLYATSKWWKK